MKKFIFLFSGLSLTFLTAELKEAEAKNTLKFIEQRNFYTELYSSFKNLLPIQEEVKAPTVKISNNLNEVKVDYYATLLSRDINTVNYLVFSRELADGSLEELFRTRITSSGRGEIEDLSSLEKIVPNTKIFVNVECFDISSGNFIKKDESKKGGPYYTSKEYRLNILEDGKQVFTRLNSEETTVENDVQILPIRILEYYDVDKYYSYENAIIKGDGLQLRTKEDAFYLPYFVKEVDLELTKNLKNWRKVKVVEPEIFKANSSEVLVKEGTNFNDFLKDNKQLFLRNNIKQNNDYIFLGYYIDDIPLEKYNSSIKLDKDILAKYKTKIIIKVDNNIENYYLLTGDSLKELNLEKYKKDYYDIESYTITDNETKKITTVSSVDEILLKNSLTITINYKKQTSKLQIRQDEYNSRFGEVDELIKDKDIDYPKNTPAKELLEDLKKSITPAKGYEVQFRINKKVINNTDILNEDAIVEIYFKKIPNDWINVKFTGEGIDKFLSDGQEVLAGENLDNINLPTSTGSSKEFLGWRANRNYKVNRDGKIIEKNNEDLLSLEEIPSIVATKGENLIFTAEYLKSYTIDIKSKSNGSISLPNNQTSLKINEGRAIKDLLQDRSILFTPKSHYYFSHFTSTLPVIVNRGNGNMKIINIGDKISLIDFYNIVPNSNLTFYAHFIFSDSITIVDNFLKNKEITDIFSIEQFKTEQKNSLSDVLGPFNYLR